MVPAPVPNRQHFRDTLAAVAAKARQVLPQAVNGRLESAVKLVLLDEITVLDDGRIAVGSCSDPAKQYLLEGTRCDCKDYEHAPDHWCKHRIAAGLHKRVKEMLKAEAPQTAEVDSHYANQPPLPEAPSSINFQAQIGAFQVQITLRDSDEARLLARLDTLLKNGKVQPLPKPAPRQKAAYRPQQDRYVRRDFRNQGR
jgi:hypothetical protein